MKVITIYALGKTIIRSMDSNSTGFVMQVDPDQIIAEFKPRELLQGLKDSGNLKEIYKFAERNKIEESKRNS